jgi:hypothetical protein
MRDLFLLTPVFYFTVRCLLKLNVKRNEDGWHLVQVLVQRLPVMSEVVVALGHYGFHQCLFHFTVHVVSAAQCLSTPCEIFCEYDVWIYAPTHEGGMLASQM